MESEWIYADLEKCSSSVYVGEPAVNLRGPIINLGGPTDPPLILSCNCNHGIIFSRPI